MSNLGPFEGRYKYFIQIQLYNSLPLLTKVTSMLWLLNEGWTDLGIQVETDYYGGFDGIYYEFSMDKKTFEEKYKK